MEVSQGRLDGLPTDDLLRLTVRAIRRESGSRLAGVIMPAGTGELVVRAWDGEVSNGNAARGDSVRSGLTAALHAHGFRTVDTLSFAPGVIGAIQHANGLLLVPMAAADRVLGAIALVRAADDPPFSADDVLVAEAFSRDAAITLQHAQVREELERLALLEERERIAMDLHDGVVQALFVVGLSLQEAEGVADDPDAIRDRLSHAIDSIDSAIRNLRDYIFGLQPTSVADRYLERTLRELAATAERSGRVSVAVNLESRAASALSTRSSTVVQAAREAISNAIQHSGGDEMNLRLVACGDQILLEITDNGRGFALNEARGRGHGLRNLQARADDLGGTLEIESESDHGTRVRFLVPR